MTDAAADPRWQRLADRDWTCSCCGIVHGGLMDIAHDHPFSWPHGNRKDSGKAVLAVGSDWLDSDTCVVGEHRFIRCVLPIPIQGTGESFAFGVWSTLSAPNFREYTATFDSGKQGALGPWSGWLSNAPPAWDWRDAVAAEVRPRDDKDRPVLTIMDPAHPGYREQREGIGIDRLLDIYAACGHDLRPHLGDA